MHEQDTTLSGKHILTVDDDMRNAFALDTVERYQGGARDIILISLCTNTIYQLEALSAHSDEGIDRKLNVALTRAREHVIILGNPILLQENDVYRALMDNVQAATTP